MRVVLAFDVSKGTSIVVAYEESETCILEDKISHSSSGFIVLQEMIEGLTKDMDKLQKLYLRPLVFTQEPLKGFYKITATLIVYLIR